MVVAALDDATSALLRQAAESTSKEEITDLDCATSQVLSIKAIVNELRLIREQLTLTSGGTAGTGASALPESAFAQNMASVQITDKVQIATAIRESMRLICLELAEAFQRLFVQGGLTLAGLQDTTITTPADLELVQYDNASAKWVNRTAAASGVVVGPASATDNALARFNLATGKLIQNSIIITDDLGNIIGVKTIDSVFVSATAPPAPTAGVPWLDTSVPSSAAGAGTLPVTTITSDTTLTSSEVVVLCDAASGEITVTLPPASSSEGKQYYLKKIDSSANKVIVDGNASETIDDGLTAELTSQYEAIEIVCDGANWNIF